MFRGRTHVNGKKLFDHQIKGIEFMVNNAIGCANTSEMGTGKTAMAVVAADEIAPMRVLIICPNILKFNWENEFTEWSELKRQFYIIDGAKNKKLKTIESAIKDDGFSVVAINYDSTSPMLAELAEYKADLIIIDESHFIKNHKSKRFKAVSKLAEKAHYKWIMTGTPTPNNPLDIWAQFQIIRPGYFNRSYYAFRARYAEVYTGAGFPIIRCFRNQDELQRMVQRYSFRVLKEDCLDLPDKVYKTLTIEMSPSAKKIYKDMAEEMVAEIVNGTEVIADVMIVKMLRLQQITSGFINVDGKPVDIGNDKIKALEEVMESLSGEHVVIWAKFNHEVKLIMDLLDKMKIRSFALTGEVKNEDRKHAVEVFQSSKEPIVIVAKPSIGGAGITLTKARYSVHFSRSFNFGDEKQSEDRVHRIGQNRKVTYIDLVCKNTIDAYISSALSKKQKLADRLTGDDVRRIISGVL